MAADLPGLRNAAAREARDRAQAEAALATAMRAAEGVRVRGGTRAELVRAKTQVETAASKLGRLADHAASLLAQATPDEVLAALEHDVPIVLLPLRLETRVLKRLGRWALLVRAYPDAIHGDAHEQQLTQAEQNAAAAFWAQPASDRDGAWAGLVAAFGAQRAAWIAEATRGRAPGAAAVARFTRPAWTQALPDRLQFCVRADGKDLPPVDGARIRQPLATGPDPRLKPDADDGTDAGMRWMTDFDTAVAQGLAARIDLAVPLPQRIDQVLVIGVKASVAPADTAALLGRLLDAHRYSDGLEVLRIGTATNAGPGGAPPGSRAAAEAVPRPAGHTIAAAADGARLARALGVPAARFAGLAGADITSEADAQAMLTALWPGTLGYFLREMLAGTVSSDESELLRAHAINWVRGRGPLAPLRVGRTPYGVLPATSLALFAPDGPHAAAAGRLLGLLRGLVPAWQEAADRMPKAGRGPASKASDTLAAILALSPVSTDIDARRVYPRNVVDLVTGLAGGTEEQRKSIAEIHNKLVDGGFAGLGALSQGDRLREILGAGRATRAQLQRVQSAPLSHTNRLVDDYIAWVRYATPDQLAAAEENFGAPLLYLLVRYALLHQYARAAETTSGLPADKREGLLDELVVVDLPGVKRKPLAIDVLGGPPPGPGGGPGPVGSMPGGPSFGQTLKDGASRLAEHLKMGGAFEQPLLETDATRARAGGPRFAVRGGGMTLRTTASRAEARELRDVSAPGIAETAQVLTALDHLAPLPSATLDRLLRETLDLASHRLDAWVTSVPTMRLSQMRATRPDGAHLGAYGVVEDLVPAPPSGTGVEPPGSPAGTANAFDIGNLGFVHAPSLGHAATAAVLRSAHAAHGSKQAFDVALESRRMRRALYLLAGVRNGQSLGALLGYQLERQLLETGGATAIAKLRDAAPLRTSALRPPTGASFEHVAPRDVLDGLRIVRDQYTAPSFTDDERPKVDAAVAAVRDALDATGDLLLAEGVHQIVAGTPARAVAAVHAAAGTAAPPERFDVLRTPRTGTGLTHRVVLVADTPGTVWIAASARTPRVLADPLLEGWAAALLGPPRRYSALVKYQDAAGGGLTATLEVRVEDLGLGALDAIATSARGAHGQLCELERRVLDWALDPASRPRGVPADASAVLAPRADHAAASSRAPLSDLVVGAAAVGELLRSARPPAPHEVDPTLPLDAAGLDMGELAKRLAAITGAAERASDGLRKLLHNVADEVVDLAQLPAALRAASLLVSAALPEVADPARAGARAILVTQGRDMLAELDRRLAVAAELVQLRSMGSGGADAAVQRREIAELLIDSAVVMAPQLEASLASTLGALVAERPSLGTGVTSAAARASVARAFLARARAVRPGVARLDDAETLCVARGGAPVTLRVAQAGTAAGAPWVALPGVPVPGGVTSLVLVGDAAFAPAAPVCALVIDDWTEVVPREREVTALAVHADRPNSEAPQAVLIAVPPDRSHAWSVATLRAVIEETLALAEMRMVDPPALGRFGHLLPALLLACTGREAQIKVPETKFFRKVPM